MAKRRATSTLIAAIILIAITLVAGVVAYSAMTSAINIASQGVRVYVETMDLRLSISGAVFTATLKNVGGKPIVLLQIKLHDEGWHIVPNIDSENPLKPGMSAGVKMAPPAIAPEKYVAGNIYTVVISARSSDGSSFSYTASVQCSGINVGACGGGGGGGGGGGEPLDFILEVFPSAGKITKPGQIEAVLRAEKLSGKTEVVTFSLENEPHGIDVSFNIGSGVLSDVLYSTASISASEEAVKGHEWLKFTAECESGGKREAWFDLEVLSESQPADFQLSVRPDAVYVGEGGRVSVDVIVTRVSGEPHVELSSDWGNGDFEFDPWEGDPPFISTLTITAPQDTGTWEVSVSGLDPDNNIYREGQFLLVVPPPELFYYSLHVDPDYVSTAPGGLAASKANIELLSGESQPVRLYAFSTPFLTVELAPAEGIPDFTSDITVYASDLAPSGTYKVLVKGYPLNKYAWLTVEVNMYYSFEEEMVYEGEGQVYSTYKTICTFDEPTYVDKLMFYAKAYGSGTLYHPFIYVYVDGVQRYLIDPMLDGYATGRIIWLREILSIGTCMEIGFRGGSSEPGVFRDVSILKRFNVTEGIALIPQADELVAEAGGQTSFTVEVEALGNAPSLAYLSASTPDGISIAFSPSEEEPPFNSTATIIVNSDVVPGFYTVWLSASGASYAVNIPITLTVTKSSLEMLSPLIHADSFDPYQRVMFREHDMLWLFWGETDGLKYRTYSISNSALGPKQQVNGFEVEKLSLYYDRQRGKLHIVIFDGDNLRYACGLPTLDGTIDWLSTGGTEILEHDNGMIETVSIIVDSNGFPWISYTYYGTALPGWEWDGFCVLKSKQNSMWETDPAASLMLEGQWHWLHEPFGTIIPLSDGKILATYTGPSRGSSICARVWDGTVWSSEVSFPAISKFGEGPAFIEDGDDLWFFVVDGDDLYSIKYSLESNSFYDRELIYDNPGPFPVSVPIPVKELQTGNIYIFWTGGDGSLYHSWRSPSSNVWATSAIIWRDEFDNGGVVCLTALTAKSSNDKLYLIYIPLDESVWLLSN